MTDAQLYQSLHDLACRTAREAGAMVLGRLGSRLDVASKSSMLDLVTEVDRASEDLITVRLLAARPSDGIVGEEGTGIVGSSDVSWLIDPIDGTTSFVYGLPGWSVSIAARVDAEVVAGVVLAPVIGSEYSAFSGGGASHNGAATRVRETPDLAAALIATGFAPDPERRTRQASLMAEILPRIRDIRRMGSAALDLATVGAGQVDAYFEVGLNPWDYAAGVLIAREGGATTVVEPDPATARAFVLAAPASIAGELLALLRGLNADKV